MQRTKQRKLSPGFHASKRCLLTCNPPRTHLDTRLPPAEKAYHQVRTAGGILSLHGLAALTSDGRRTRSQVQGRGCCTARCDCRHILEAHECEDAPPPPPPPPQQRPCSIAAVPRPCCPLRPPPSPLSTCAPRLAGGAAAHQQPGGLPRRVVCADEGGSGAGGQQRSRRRDECWFRAAPQRRHHENSSLRYCAAACRLPPCVAAAPAQTVALCSSPTHP